MRTERANFLDLEFDLLPMKEVKRELAQLRGGYRYVVTPNVDHLVRLHKRPELRALYQNSALCLCDSRILLLLARFAGVQLPLVPGSDLTEMLFRDVIRSNDKVAVIGGSAKTADNLRRRYPQVRFCHHEAPFGLPENPEARKRAATFAVVTGARFIFIAVGSPQQEMIASEIAAMNGARGTALCVGASLEFITGQQRRAPKWVQRVGMEWAHRLFSNPRRLWRRYLVEGVRIFPIFFRSLGGPSRRQCSFLALSAVVVLSSIGLYGSSSVTRARTVPPIDHFSQPAAAGMTLPAPGLLRPLSPEAAIEVNNERPFVQREDSPASPFVLEASATDTALAETCLAQAAYYEAAGEGSEGMRAVAQVVLNRVRHPAYPDNVCGVVYQGSGLKTGCQFTFTCDGALARKPSGPMWQEARAIAKGALSGAVFGAVGHATHYHADSVLPYWADSLDKTLQIGHHIFYRLPGQLGSSRAFRQAYVGGELDYNHVVAAAAAPTEDPSLLEALTDSSAHTDGPTPVASDIGPRELAADSRTGTLLVDLQHLKPEADRPGCLKSDSVASPQTKVPAAGC
jgi:exopolysaccharide biosynthesis WecB/TagA/CpsF family protein